MPASLPRVWAIEGPSGVGKSTVARMLERPGRWTFVAEAFDRIRPRPDLDFSSPAELLRLERRLLAEEIRRMRLAEEIASGGRHAIVDTSPIGPALYTASWSGLTPGYEHVAAAITEELGEAVAEGRLRLPEKVVCLVTAVENIERRRLGAETSHPAALADRHARVALGERRFWHRLAPHAGGAIRFVEATGPPERVAHLTELAFQRAGARLDPAQVVSELEAFTRGRARRGGEDPPRTSTVKNRTQSRRLPRRP